MRGPSWSLQQPNPSARASSDRTEQCPLPFKPVTMLLFTHLMASSSDGEEERERQ